MSDKMDALMMSLSNSSSTSTATAASSTADTVLKSGPLLISSKGLGWRLWKRRWFILTCTSLVFYKHDPKSGSGKGIEAFVALGGIELDNSASLLIQTDRRLLTIVFPDGRAYSLKAENVEDFDEWKIALQQALDAAPTAIAVFTEKPISAIELELLEGSSVKRGRKGSLDESVTCAFKDVNGNLCFLERTLCFIEEYGAKSEWILRQSADVDEVHQRILAYEQGNDQFGPEDNAYVVSDCIKFWLRTLPSAIVSTSCCTSLLEAQKMGKKDSKVCAMRNVVMESLPGSNLAILVRVLKMMRVVVAHNAENHMTASAVAACMAPLILRPLVAGECGTDISEQINEQSDSDILAAAAAALNAQSIVTTMLEEYENIFEDASPEQEMQTEKSGIKNEVVQANGDVAPDNSQTSVAVSESRPTSEALEGIDLETSTEDKVAGNSAGRESVSNRLYNESRLSSPGHRVRALDHFNSESKASCKNELSGGSISMPTMRSTQSRLPCSDSSKTLSKIRMKSPNVAGGTRRQSKSGPSENEKSSSRNAAVSAEDQCELRIEESDAEMPIETIEADIQQLDLKVAELSAHLLKHGNSLPQAHNEGKQTRRKSSCNERDQIRGVRLPEKAKEYTKGKKRNDITTKQQSLPQQASSKAVLKGGRKIEHQLPLSELEQMKNLQKRGYKTIDLPQGHPLAGDGSHGTADPMTFSVPNSTKNLMTVFSSFDNINTQQRRSYYNISQSLWAML